VRAAAKSLPAAYGPLAVVLAELLMTDLGMGLTMPVLPLYAARLGATLAVVGLVVGAFGLSRFLLDLPAGFLAGRLGPRFLLLAGPLFIAAAATTAYLATSPWILGASRLLEGAGSAAVNTVSMVFLARQTQGRGDRGRVMSIYQGVRRGGAGIAPLLGGLAADRFGFHAVYAIYAFLALGATSWAVLKIPRDLAGPAQPPARPSGRRSFDPFLRSAGFVLISLLALSFFFGRISSRRLLVPLLGHQLLGMSTGSIGAALTLATLTTLATLYFSGHLADRFGSRPIALLGGLLGAAGVLGYLLAHSVSAFFAASLFWGFCTGLGGPARNMYLMDITPAGRYPVVVGVYRTVADAGFLAGPPILGLVAHLAGLRISLAVAALLFLAATAAFAAWAPRPRPASLPQG
jgi:MFS family permease